MRLAAPEQGPRNTRALPERDFKSRKSGRTAQAGKSRLLQGSKCRWHRRSSESELCEGESGQILGDRIRTSGALSHPSWPTYCNTSVRLEGSAVQGAKGAMDALRASFEHLPKRRIWRMNHVSGSESDG